MWACECTQDRDTNTARENTYLLGRCVGQLLVKFGRPRPNVGQHWPTFVEFGSNLKLPEQLSGNSSTTVRQLFYNIGTRRVRHRSLSEACGEQRLRTFRTIRVSLPHHMHSGNALGAHTWGAHSGHVLRARTRGTPSTRALRLGVRRKGMQPALLALEKLAGEVPTGLRQHAPSVCPKRAPRVLRRRKPHQPPSISTLWKIRVFRPWGLFRFPMTQPEPVPRVPAKSVCPPDCVP